MISVRKSPNMMSTTGRRPVIAAPTPRPVKPGFGDRRVDDALLAELLDEAGEHLEGGARLGDVLAEDDDARVAAHLLGQRLADRFAERDLASVTHVAAAGHAVSGIDVLDPPWPASGYGAFDRELHGRLHLACHVAP